MSNLQENGKLSVSTGYWLAAALLVLGLGAGVARAGDDHRERDRDRRGRHCTLTALDQNVACLAEVRDDFFAARAICRNVLDVEEREECSGETRTLWKEGHATCRDQLKGRRELCALIGEGRYDPEFEAELFDDPRNPSNPNAYFPLAVGNRWVYEEDGGEEVITVEVLDKTKLIDGVTCIVVNDLVVKDGNPIEDTDDWFGVRKDGGVSYCGESVRDFETFEGDDPQEAELIAIDGSFKAGRDGDLAGTLFLAQPVVGVTYRQEWSAGNAEDAATVISTSYRHGASPELDRGIDPELAEHLCSAADCIVTRDFNPMEPGHFQYKYYARGLGLFAEVNPDSGSIVELQECNVHPKCQNLP